ncbi:MAG TPA: 30S ribosomal protein S6 [Flavobacteriales bacterium]|nr:30S ribosomal protein S6 [Flavobacteriales bacterium]
MNSQYEIVLIMTPVLSEQQRKDAVKGYIKIIKGGSCEIVHEENWGLKKLAYPIQKKSTGYYYCVEFKGSGQIISTLELTLKRDEKILRFLTVKLDKHAIAFNIKDREKAKVKKESPKEEEVKAEVTEAVVDTPKAADERKKGDVQDKESNATKSEEDTKADDSKKDKELVAEEETTADDSKKDKELVAEQEENKDAPEETKTEDSESEEPKEEVINS